MKMQVKKMDGASKMGQPAPSRKAPKTKGKGPWLRLGVLAALVITAGVLLAVNQGAAPGALPAKEEITKGLQALLEAGPTASREPQTSGPALSQRRSLREEAYQEDREALLALTKNAAVATQTREDAAAQLTRMVEYHQQELAIEEALQAAGFTPCLVLMENGALTVMVTGAQLSQGQSATILSLCAAHAPLPMENIRIMEGQ